MSTFLGTLIETLNLQLGVLETSNLKIYDNENEEFYINEFYYDAIDDKVKFKCSEERQ